MAIVDYSSLQTAVANYLHRSDLTAIIPDFISLAEAKLSRRLRLRAMEQSVSATISGNSTALPAGFREVRSLYINDGSNSYRLEYKTPEQRIPYLQSGRVNAFTIIGSDIHWLPQPNGTLTYTLNYYEGFDPLEDGQNWLILNAPDVYLYATLLEAAPYMKGDNRIETWNTLMEGAIGDLLTEDRSSRIGNTLAVSTDNPVRLG